MARKQPLAKRTAKAADSASTLDLDAGQAERIAALAKALAHPARINIVRILMARTTCVGCDIVEQIGLAQSTTSEHLRVLKAAGVIVGEIERPRVCYSLAPGATAALAEFLEQMVSAPSLNGAESTDVQRF
ncbi:MAG: transcriptional regulator [Phenylobacterium sp. SCN 69-14]|nr:MAG: transcriptional regulator [Phenylobacterium sp. SCN 69-14]